MSDTPGAEDVAASVGALATALEHRDPSPDELKERAGSLRWNCGATLAHICDAVLWYAGNLASRSTSDADTPTTSPTAKPTVLLSRLRSSGALLAAAVRDAPDDARGYHSWGRPDRSGFAAMGCDEVLVHGYDLSLGLKFDFVPPPVSVERTLRRLFPWAPSSDEADPWEALLWANGRHALGLRLPETKWLWHCAPLDEWDGEIRRMRSRRRAPGAR